MKFAIHECSTVKTFDGIETGQLFIRKNDIDTNDILYLKGKNLNKDYYIDLETGSIIPAGAFNSVEKDLVFPITDYNLEVYFSKEV